MNILILQSSPNDDGLTAACAQSALEGIQQTSSQAELVCVNDLTLNHCRACERGWGTCQREHLCQLEDDFQALHQRILRADGLVLVTPVYWGEMSESTKALTDRLRRCEATRGAESGLAGRAFLAVAAAGGSGNGTITCLSSLERFAQHVRARVFDLLPVNRWTRGYKLETIHAAAQALAVAVEQGWE
jgi:multimeric flavodoxin WrbA